jgi:hypothetical protein
MRSSKGQMNEEEAVESEALLALAATSLSAGRATYEGTSCSCT